MFKWPGTPSPRAPEHELADFVELTCWRQGSTSVAAITKLLGRLDENDYADGVPEEEEASGVVEDAYYEIERRRQICRDGYPFLVENHGHTLRVNEHGDSRQRVIYRYLLLATRLNMRDNRNHADIDGTLLFEELSAETGREYFGERAESMVFGTAAKALHTFQEKINLLCRKIGEGDGYRRGNQITQTHKDDKLDVVVWKHFTDQLPGKLVGFGQCKTGTNYGDTLTQLRPDSFCNKWLITPLSLIPVRMFFLAEALPRSDWYNSASDAGLLFDRCRIIDFGKGVCEDLLARIDTWTTAAAQATKLTN